MEIIVKIEKTKTMKNSRIKAKTVKFLYDSGLSSPGAFYFSGSRPGGLEGGVGGPMASSISDP